MSVFAVCSAHGAPGATTTALAMTWSWPLVQPERRVLLVDADPAGSGLLTGLLRTGVAETAGLLALAARRAPLSAEDVIECAVALDADSARMVVPGVAEPLQARPLNGTWNALRLSTRELGRLGVDVVLDVGRLGHRYEPTPLLEEADLVTVVVRGDLASLVPAAAAIRALRAARPGRIPPGALVIGSGYSPAEISEALEVSATLSLPRDEWAASALTSGRTAGWRFDRSPLLRSARAVVERLARLAPDPSSVVLS